MHVDADELMAYFDGELSPGRAARVEQTLDRDPESRAMLAEWELVGDAVRDWFGCVSESHQAATDRIARDFDAPTAGSVVPFPAPTQSCRLAHGDSEGQSRAHRTIPAVDLTNPVGLPAHSAWRHAAGAALAVAAAALLLVKTAGHDSRFGPDVHQLTRTKVLGLTGRDVRACADDQPGAAIESLDLGERQGTIFLVSGGSEVTPVVWVEDSLPSEDGTNALPSEDHGRDKTL